MSLATFRHPDVGVAVVGAELVLDGPEGRHAAVVRRLAVGERIRLTDGAGAYADGPVTAVSTRPPALTVRVEDAGVSPAPKPRLVVLQAVPKSDRAQLTVEVLTEIGVDVIVPWNAERSQQRWSAEHLDRLVDRWRGWTFAASKQARRTRFAEVADPVGTEQAVALLRPGVRGLVLHEQASRPLDVVLEEDASPAEVVLVVGPEGGLTDDELERFAASGAEVVRLGDEVLRTSTAGVAAAAAVLARTRWRTPPAG